MLFFNSTLKDCRIFTQHTVDISQAISSSLYKKMSSNKLVEIPCIKWHKLRDLYIDHNNRSSAYEMIENFIDWSNKDPSIKNLNIYSLNGDWESDGTFVLEWADMICSNTLNTESNNRLITALNCLDVNKSYLYAAVVERVLPAVYNHLESHGFHENDCKVDITAWYYISKEKARKFKIDTPPGIVLKTLNENHVDTVNNIWPHKHPGSDIFVRTLISYNLNIGAFQKDGTLIAWCLRLPFGSLGLLQVVEEHKRKGLGQLLVRAMSKQIASSGHEVMAPVIVHNTPSRNMFEKLGFTVIDHVYWVRAPNKS